MEYIENYRQLAAQIIIEIIEDYHSTRDKYRKEAMIKWFDTPYGSALCEFTGVDPDVIKEEVIRNENYQKTYSRYDYT